MSNNKITAAEWVLQYLKNVKPNEFCSIEKIKELLEQAKAMEKEQIIKFTNDYLDDDADLSAEQYYNETYGSEGSDAQMLDRIEPKQETLEDITLEEVFGSEYCQFSVVENKLAILYRNQEQLLKAIKLL